MRSWPSRGMRPRGFVFGNLSKRDEMVRKVIYRALYKRCTIHYQPPGWRDSRLNVPLCPATFPEYIASVTTAVGGSGGTRQGLMLEQQVRSSLPYCFANHLIQPHVSLHTVCFCNNTLYCKDFYILSRVAFAQQYNLALQVEAPLRILCRHTWAS